MRTFTKFISVISILALSYISVGIYAANNLGVCVYNSTNQSQTFHLTIGGYTQTINPKTVSSNGCSFFKRGVLAGTNDVQFTVYCKTSNKQTKTVSISDQSSDQWYSFTCNKTKISSGSKACYSGKCA